MKKAVLALGFFDGVHKGHEKIIKTASEIAKKRGLSCVCLTFETHPQAIVSGKAPEMITTDEEKTALIKKCGAEKVTRLRFDEKTASMAPEEFARYIKEELSCAVAVCGESFRFGKGAAGEPSDLERFGVETVVCDEVKISGETVSSTLIRELIKKGDVARARLLLGRPFSLSGPVARGRGVGHTISYPTANTEIKRGMLVPASGVYITRVVRDGAEYRSLTDVGTHPTFEEGAPVSVESHLLGYKGDLYGKEIKVLFYDRIRDERRFKSAGELRRQIEKDVSFAEEFFSREEIK